jgi:hypothetical protein
MELKSMIDFVFYIGNLDIARKSSHKEMALINERQTTLWMFVPVIKTVK